MLKINDTFYNFKATWAETHFIFINSRLHGQNIFNFYGYNINQSNIKYNKMTTIPFFNFFFHKILASGWKYGPTNLAKSKFQKC